MVAASLLHYLHGRSRMLAAAVIVVVLLVGLCLLAYAAFASGLMRDPLPDGQLIAPFRWMLDDGYLA